jgi:hypothetical protein
VNGRRRRMHKRRQFPCFLPGSALRVRRSGLNINFCKSLGSIAPLAACSRLKIEINRNCEEGPALKAVLPQLRATSLSTLTFCHQGGQGSAAGRSLGDDSHGTEAWQ